MEKCLLAGAGTNSVVLGCSKLLGSAGSQQINYPHLLRSEGMGGSLPESPSNLFLVFGELAPVPVMLHRQAGKSQQPRLAVWMLAGGELTAQESVLGTADMFKWRARSQTKMAASKVWKLHRVTPVPCTSPLGAGTCRGCLSGGQERGGRGAEERSFPTSQPGRSRVALPWKAARGRERPGAAWQWYSSAGVWQELPRRGVTPGIPFARAPPRRGLALPPGLLALAWGSGSSLPDMRMNVFISTQSARTCVF